MVETLLASLGVRSCPHPYRLLARCVVSVGQNPHFLCGEIISDISFEEDLLYPLPDLHFGHCVSMRSRRRVQAVSQISTVVIVGLARRSGARVVPTNRDKTLFDKVVTLRMWTGIGEVISPVLKRPLGEQPKRF